MPRIEPRRASIVRNPAFLAGLAVVVLLIVTLAVPRLDAGPKPEELPLAISVSEAHDLYGGPDVFFLDVRQPEEWEAFHAPASSLIPLDQLDARLDEVPRDKTIVVVCRSGNRSQQGRDILLAAGFENVTSMAGGLTEWQAMGYETVSGP